MHICKEARSSFEQEREGSAFGDSGIGQKQDFGFQNSSKICVQYTFCGKVGKVYPHYFEVKVKDRWIADGLYGNDEEQDDNKVVPNKNVTVGYFQIHSIKIPPLCDKLPQ